MNLLDLGDSLIYIFAMLHQADLYEFAFASKRARRLVITYIKRVDACEYINDPLKRTLGGCVSHGHILCALTNKHALSGRGLYALFSIGNGLNETSNVVCGAQMIVDRFRNEFERIVDESLPAIVNATMGNNNPMFWNTINFTPLRLEQVEDALLGHEYWSEKHERQKIFDLLRDWNLDGTEKRMLLLIIAPNKIQLKIYNLSTFCSFGFLSPKQLNWLRKHCDWIICGCCNKRAADH
jgi:hypothetical protein